MMKKKLNQLGDIGDTRLRLLRIYKAVVECEGFTAAEVELNISRSAISIAILDLEQYLGFKLCQRGRKGFALTNEGAGIYDSVSQLFGAMDTFRTQVNDLHSQLRGELNIGITDNMVTMPHMHITNALIALKDQGSEVRINIRMMPPTDIELKVLSNELHVGVVPELRVISGLEYIPLYNEKSLLYCSSKHPLFNIPEDKLSKELIAQQDAILPAYAQTPEIKKLHQNLKGSASATDREGVAFLLLTGRFIGFLPKHYAQKWEETGNFKALLPNEMSYFTNYFAIKNKSARPNLVRDTYLDLLKSIIVKSNMDD